MTTPTDIIRMNPEIAQGLMDDLWDAGIRPSSKTKKTFNNYLIDASCDAVRMHPTDFWVKNRRATPTIARNFVCAYMREVQGLTWQRIADILNVKDHCVIIHRVKTHHERLETESNYRKMHKQFIKKVEEYGQEKEV